VIRGIDIVLEKDSKAGFKTSTKTRSQ